MKSNPKRARPRRRRARNVPLPVVRRANPLILENPPRRRRRRRANPKMDLAKAGMGALWLSGGSLVGTGLNVVALNNIEDMWIRNGLRWATAIASTYAKNAYFGGALGGAALYPFWQEMFVMVLGDDTVATEDVDVLNDQLGQLEADLEQALNEVTREDLAA